MRRREQEHQLHSCRGLVYINSKNANRFIVNLLAFFCVGYYDKLSNLWDAIYVLNCIARELEGRD